MLAMMNETFSLIFEHCGQTSKTKTTWMQLTCQLNEE